MAAKQSRVSIKPADVVHLVAVKKAHAGPSLVTKDGIMKEVVRLEEETKKTWDAKYGFLRNTFEDFEKELRERGINYKQRACLSKKVRVIETSEGSIALPSQLPKTASGMVGWLACNASHLNIAGPLYVSPKHTVYPPNSSELFLKKQQFIILG